MAAHTYHAGDRAGGIPIPPRRRTRPLNLSRYRRERIEALVEVLIGMLDALDESDDREPGADGAEPGEDDEASAQAPVTPGSTRPTLPLPVMVRA